MKLKKMKNKFKYNYLLNFILIIKKNILNMLIKKKNKSFMIIR